MKIPRVTLELVRQGPPHNQLLSPLTPYFAICGNHEPEIVHVPFEHATLLRKLKNMRYRGPGGAGADSEISADAEDVSRALTDMLSSIRSLHGTLQSIGGSGARLVVLELVVSAAELSLLPFELVFRPGMPTRNLCAAEVVVLRRTRRVPATSMNWPVRPRVLFAYSDVAGPVPFDRHALALRECLSPWLAHVQGEDPLIAASEAAKYVTVIERASLQSIREVYERMAARDQEITHVHILSHGTSRDGKFGLALHDPADPVSTDFVSGERLVGALNAMPSNGRRKVPACVTIAACDAGNVGDVVYVGASVAHELHEGGVPFVVASQLPLSFRGSVAMVRELYEHLLLVTDPQVALAKTRHAVRGWSSAGKGLMDWASIVAYGALPKRLDAQVSKGRMEQGKRAVESALGIADPWVSADAGAEDEHEVSSEKILEAWRHLQGAFALVEAGDPSAERSAYLGAVYKRWAEIVSLSKGDPLPSELRGPAIYRKALEHYLDAYARSATPYMLVQALACRCFLASHSSYSNDVAASPEASLATIRQDEWQAALQNIRIRSRLAQEPWARLEDDRALLELQIMAPLVFTDDESLKKADADIRGTRDIDPAKLIESVVVREGADSFELYSLRRQARRFLALEQRSTQRDSPVLESTATKEGKYESRVGELLGELVRQAAPETWTAVMDYRSFAGNRIPAKSSTPDPA